jgi:hypothetical protein
MVSLFVDSKHLLLTSNLRKTLNNCWGMFTNKAKRINVAGSLTDLVTGKLAMWLSGCIEKKWNRFVE